MTKMTTLVAKQPTVDPATALPEVQKMIYSLVWSTVKRTGFTFEETLSEAYAAFMKACYDYNPDKGQKFSSWVYFWVWCKLKDMEIARAKDPMIPTEINEEVLGEAPPQVAPSLELISDLSGDAQELVSLLLETPTELVGRPMTAKQLLHKVKAYLVEHGWTKERTDRAHEEVHTRLNHAWKGFPLASA